MSKDCCGSCECSPTPKPIALDELEPDATSDKWRLGLALTAAAVSEALHWYFNGNHPVVMILAGLAIAMSGLELFADGWRSLRNRTLDMNVLTTVAVFGALLIGHWPEAAMVTVLFAISEVIEDLSVTRAHKAIHDVLDLAPNVASVQQPDGSWTDTDVTTVTPGMRVRVRPGERIALDGAVVAGRSAVDQSPITGESVPVEKLPGDVLFAGTINQTGSLEYTVSTAADDTTLARIIRAVEEVQGSKAPTQRFVDKFAAWYTPSVFVAAILVAVVPTLLGGHWLDWLYRALVLLVVACPCALVISVPVGIVSGLAAAARHGILIKGGEFLEQGHRLRWLAFDKTGTITQGKPTLTDEIVLDGVEQSGADVTGTALASTDAEGTRTDTTPRADYLRQVAVSLAAHSNHPVSVALVRANPGLATLDVTDFEAVAGRGVWGMIDGQRYSLGNAALAAEVGVEPSGWYERYTELERDGKTATALVGPDGVRMLFALADVIKPTSREAISDCAALGVHTMMLTGDNQHIAKVVGAQAGIESVRGGLLPEDKLEEIEDLAKQGVVGMVGDGINDAPALARANIGFAMGAAGSDTAIETADVALMDDDLRKVGTFLRISRATRSILMQNIVFALSIKAVFMALTLAGMATMWMAVFADTGVTLLVVANSLRLLRR